MRNVNQWPFFQLEQLWDSWRQVSWVLKGSLSCTSSLAPPCFHLSSDDSLGDCLLFRFFITVVHFWLLQEHFSILLLPQMKCLLSKKEILRWEIIRIHFILSENVETVPPRFLQELWDDEALGRAHYVLIFMQICWHLCSLPSWLLVQSLCWTRSQLGSLTHSLTHTAKQLNPDIAMTLSNKLLQF